MESRCCFVEVDLIQAEWVVTAHLAQDANMLEVVRSGADPHLRTAELIIRAPKELIKAENSLVGHLSDPTIITERRANELPECMDYAFPRTMSGRQMGKKANHALNYNMQYRRFSLWAEIEEREASRIVSLYRDQAYPGLKGYYREIEHELRTNNRYLSNCYGETRQFLDRWGPDLLDAAYAFKPQSTVGNQTNFGLKGVYHDVTHLPRVDPRAQVHDSLLTHHWFDTWQELAEQCGYCLYHMTTQAEYHGTKFYLGRELKLGVAWGEDTMIEVAKLPYTEGDDPGSFYISPEALEKAWNESCAAAAA